MIRVNDFFDLVFCINLPRRTDRRIEAEYEFDKNEIDVCWINGVDGRELENPAAISFDSLPVSKGDWGCTLSHLNIVIEAKRLGLKNYLVFEDDVALVDNFNDQFDLKIKTAPKEWDFLYFGGDNVGGIESVNDHWAKIFKTNTTHAYAVNHTIYDKLIEVLSQKEKVDICISSLHSVTKSFICRPHLAWQKASHSDILNVHSDYVKLKNLMNDGSAD